VRQLPRI